MAAVLADAESERIEMPNDMDEDGYILERILIIASYYQILWGAFEAFRV